ncbi:putative T7SS-secreted protein [Streptomyces sp. NPDC052396]|uniref:putative T7SS-secreted protein n=1 Tax=Streptomyces sp. NPDC052396 TaxID=3365689 RepID=UPI0037D81615
MDIGKGFSKLGHGAKGLWNEGKKDLGEAVHWSTDKTGDLLDDVGAHDTAKSVRHWGEEKASDLGAHVGEHQLGDSDDPKDLIHGDVKQLNATAKHLRTFHTSFNSVHSGLQRIHSGEWKGEGADAFDAKFAPEPGKWAKAADACEKAAGALEAYAHTVSWAQGQAKEAIRLYKQGKAASEKARKDYNDKVDAYKAKAANHEDPGPVPAPFTDPGEADLEKAQHLLAEARKQRNTAGSEAQSKIDAAVQLAPPKPSMKNRLKADLLDAKDGSKLELLHFGGGVFRAGTDLVKMSRMVNPLDPYNMTHPAMYLDGLSTMSAGLLSMASHPERLPKALLGDGWSSDPSQSGGRLFGNALLMLTGGGEAAAAERGAMSAAKRGAEEGAERGAQNAARGHLNDNPNDLSRSPAAKTCEKDPVDVATGRMLLPQTDVTLPAALPLVFRRHFETSYRAGQWFGPGWASTADQRLEIDAEGVIFIGEDGVLLSYPHPVADVPTLPTKGVRWPLAIATDGTYTVTDPLTGRTWHFSPQSDQLALLDELTDRNGHRIVFAYDADGTPTAITHDGGYRIRITTDSGRITALHLAGAATDGSDLELIRYGYTNGHLTHVFNSSGLPLLFGYDQEGRITSWTDRNGSRFDYVYDQLHRCVAQSGTEGHMRSRFEYGEPDPETGLRTTVVTGSLGHTSRYLINDVLQVVAEVDPNGAVARSRWDRHNRLIAQTDALDRTTEFTYDADGRLTRVVRPDGSELTTVHDDMGQPKETQGPDGSVWRQTCDEAGNRMSVTDPTGAQTRYTYDEYGHPASVTDALGNTTRIACNTAGLPMEITDPLGGVTSYRRDPFGRITTIIDPLGATTRLTWTTEGKLARRISADGSEETWTYDGEGNCIRHTDALGGVTTYEYTHFDLLTAQTTPDGVRHEFTHDTDLNLRQVTNPQGLTWTYDYDPVGRLISETDFDGRTLSYTHDADGQLISRSNALGEAITYEHDALGHVVTKTAPNGHITTYTYGPAGRLLEATNPDATLIYHRDRLGRVKSETTNGRTITFAYDALGRRTRRITPSGATSTWTYDAAGRRTSLTASGHTFNLERDAAGREITRHFGDDTTLIHNWDPLGRLTSQTLTSGAETTTPLIDRAYTYRRDGYLTGIADSRSGTRTFDLDAIGRVTAVNAPGWTERYAYDSAGNQTEASWPTEHPGAEAQGSRTYTGTRITRAGNVRYEYDDQGRIVLRQKTRLSRKPDTWRYEWDAEDRLIAVVTPDGSRWHYLYDPLGRRIAKERLTETGEIAEQVNFTWDGPTLTEQTTASAGHPNQVTLTWDHNGLHPVTQTEKISAVNAPQQEIDRRFFAIITDLIGTPTELVDESGKLAWYTRSTLWGATAWSTDSSAYTPLRFPGQYFDPETGLHYNFHRHYDPETGRYASADPLGLTPAPNPATYVRNPHNWSDPLGLAPCPPEDSGDVELSLDKPERAGGAQAIPGLRDDGSTVIHGHGGYRGDGTFEMPEGTKLYMYVKDGKALDQLVGLRIAGPGGPRVPYEEMFGPGDTVPNYTLSPLGRHPQTGLPLKYREGSIVVDEPTLLSDILKPGMGDCHWVACRRPGFGNG